MVVLAVRSVTLDGAVEGVKFFLIPDFVQMQETGLGSYFCGNESGVLYP